MDVVFETERLVGRRPVPEDEAHYRALFFAPEVARWLRPPPLRPFTLMDPALALDADVARWATAGFGPCLLFDRGDAFVGRVGLAETSVEGQPCVELAWALMPAFHGQGLAGEAADALVAWARRLGIPEVVALTLPHNAASRGVMEHVGMVRSRDVEHARLPHVLYRLTLAS